MLLVIVDANSVINADAHHAAIHVTIKLQGMPYIHVAIHVVIHAASHAASCYGSCKWLHQ